LRAALILRAFFAPLVIPAEQLLGDPDRRRDGDAECGPGGDLLPGRHSFLFSFVLRVHRVFLLSFPRFSRGSR
jgi:hypothetical protein